jgi:hypothetical protein
MRRQQLFGAQQTGLQAGAAQTTGLQTGAAQAATVQTGLHTGTQALRQQW